MATNIKLDRLNSTPLYIQIVNQIIGEIRAGVLKDGTRLPAERKLAELLGLNRSTVVNAYSELEARGYVTSHVGRGTMVSAPSGKEQVETFRWNELLSGQGESLINPYSNAMSQLLYKRDNLILMDSGIAAPELYPTEMFAHILNESLVVEGKGLLQHNSPQGLKSLRESLVDMMKIRGIQVPPEDITVLNGSQQGLDIVARILLEPGDCVIIEQPCFLGAVDMFRAYGVKLIGIPTDEEGMVVERLEKILNRVRPKLIYTIPTFQNPTGACMSLARRKHLLDLANRYQVPILEDDAYGLLHFEKPALPALKSMDTTGIVIYLSTMSKILCPGLRIGWVAAPQGLVKLIAAAKQLTDLHNNNLLQRMIDIFYRRGLLEKHLDVVREKYLVKRNVMLYALEQFAPREITWTKPDGGLYIWVSLPENLSAVKLLEEGLAQNISFVAGPAFYSSEGGQNKLRLNFTYSSPEMIQQGIKTLCKIINNFQINLKGTERSTFQETIPIV